MNFKKNRNSSEICLTRWGAANGYTFNNTNAN